MLEQLRSYTNKDNEFIEVSDSHLDTAIKIKEELQKLSPSGRVSWAKHKKMMEIEDFHDSENSETYRCMIKAEQKARGILPSATTYAEMVSDNKLEAIRQEIGEIRDTKLDAQRSFRNLNKMKRELSQEIALIESLERVMKDKDYSEQPVFKPFYNPKNSSKEMVMCLSDVHYGALVNVEGRLFNTEIAESLVYEYLKKVIEIASDNNVKKIYFMGLGDYFEHDSMRIQNTFNAEKTLTKQVSDFTDIIIDMLKILSKHVEVEYSAIGGNHDRIAGRKPDAIYGEHMVTLSNKVVETFIKYSGNEKLTYVETEPYHHILKLYGKNFLFIHGDMTSIKKPNVLAEQSALYNLEFDALISGHVHHFNMRESGEDKYVVSFGSIKGSDEYTLKTLNTSSSRSQGVIIVDEDGEFEIKKIKL